MTDNTIDGEVDGFYNKVFEHAFRLGQEFPDEKAIPHDPCNAEDKLKLNNLIAQETNKAVVAELERLFDRADGDRSARKYTAIIEGRIKILKSKLIADKENA